MNESIKVLLRKGFVELKEKVWQIALKKDFVVRWTMLMLRFQSGYCKSYGLYVSLIKKEENEKFQWHVNTTFVIIFEYQ